MFRKILTVILLALVNVLTETRAEEDIIYAPGSKNDILGDFEEATDLTKRDIQIAHGSAWLILGTLLLGGNFYASRLISGALVGMVFFFGTYYAVNALRDKIDYIDADSMLDIWCGVGAGAVGTILGFLKLFERAGKILIGFALGYISSAAILAAFDYEVLLSDAVFYSVTIVSGFIGALILNLTKNYIYVPILSSFGGFAVLLGLEIALSSDFPAFQWDVAHEVMCRFKYNRNCRGKVRIWGGVYTAAVFSTVLSTISYTGHMFLVWYKRNRQIAIEARKNH
jgi:hypothetical protein